MLQLRSGRKPATKRLVYTNTFFQQFFRTIFFFTATFLVDTPTMLLFFFFNNNNYLIILPTWVKGGEGKDRKIVLSDRPLQFLLTAGISMICVRSLFNFLTQQQFFLFLFIYLFFFENIVKNRNTSSVFFSSVRINASYEMIKKIYTGNLMQYEISGVSIKCELLKQM